MALDNIVSEKYALSADEKDFLRRNYRTPDNCADITPGIFQRLESVDHMDILDIKMITKMAYHAFKKDSVNFPYLDKLISFYDSGIDIAKRWESCPALVLSPNRSSITYSVSKMISHMERYLGELIFEKYLRTLKSGCEDRMLLFQARDLVSQALENSYESNYFYLASSYMSRASILMHIAHISPRNKRRRIILQEISDINKAMEYFRSSTDNPIIISSCERFKRCAEMDMIKTTGRVKKGPESRRLFHKKLAKRAIEQPPIIDFQDDD